VQGVRGKDGGRMREKGKVERGNGQGEGERGNGQERSGTRSGFDHKDTKAQRGQGMRIYIAASWKHEHAVELLTRELERAGHKVISFVRVAVRVETGFDLVPKLDQWIASEDGGRKFGFDLKGATESDLVIYLGPSGSDAWAEVGAAWASQRTILGLTAKGEQIGLCRRMITAWATSVSTLLEYVAAVERDRMKAAG